MLLAALVALVAAAVQSATGFGFALLLGPLLFATLEPRAAVTALLVAGLAQNLLVLAGERRRPQVRWEAVGPLLGAALPGVLLGALVLDALPQGPLQVAVGVAVVAATAAQALAGRGAGGDRPAGRRRPHLTAAAAVGLGAGALTTSTSVNGPPIMLWLRALGSRPGELRDSLAVCFAVLSVAGTAAVSALGAGSGRLEAGTVAALLPAVVAGHAAGRVAFARLHPGLFGALGMVLAVVAGLASIVAGLVP